LSIVPSSPSRYQYTACLQPRVRHLVSVLGLIVTIFLLPETRGDDLQELTEEPSSEQAVLRAATQIGVETPGLDGQRGQPCPVAKSYSLTVDRRHIRIESGKERAERRTDAGWNCAKLKYETQYISKHTRCLSTCRSIRWQLGGSANLLERFPDRPKGMRQTRYYKLWRRAFRAAEFYWADTARRFHL